MNNNLLKVQFFALYWGQTVFVNPILSQEPVNNTYLFEHADPEDIDQEYLLLKPLTEINDKDALECAKLNKSINWNNGLEPSVWKNIKGHAVVSNGSGLYQKYGQVLIAEEFLNHHQIDYLRLKGYALSWNDYTIEQMIKFGWIKLIES